MYDVLSSVGREQARALGRWFHRRGVRFDAVVCGGLNRQRLTAQYIIEAMGDCRPITVDLRWNEFDLDEVYAGIGPQLATEDAQFCEEYEELRRESADPASAAHRAWRKCDVMVVRAWIAGRYEYPGESFCDLIARVREARRDLPRGDNIAVVTSATPIGISIGSALEAPAHLIMRLASGYNTAFSEIDVREEGVWVRSFNNAPHLDDERMRTLR